MIIELNIAGSAYQADLDKPRSIGIPLQKGEQNPRCFYATHPHVRPVVSGDFTGSVQKGSSVNFYTITYIPHGNGTHTECVGHLSPEMESVNDALKSYHFLCEIISVQPIRKDADLVITKDALIDAISHQCEALVIRTLPNSIDKLHRDYSGSNPPYISKDAMQLIVDRGYEHLLIDLPSVDREQDDGKLVSHKLFWNYPNQRETHKTITELIFVDDRISDGLYLLNLQIGNIALDAVHAHPVIYSLKSKE